MTYLKLTRTTINALSLGPLGKRQRSAVVALPRQGPVAATILREQLAQRETLGMLCSALHSLFTKHLTGAHARQRSPHQTYKRPILPTPKCTRDYSADLLLLSSRHAQTHPRTTAKNVCISGWQSITPSASRYHFLALYAHQSMRVAIIPKAMPLRASHRRF